MRKILLPCILILLTAVLYGEGGFEYLYIDNSPITSSLAESGSAHSFNIRKNPAASYNAEFMKLYAFHSEYFIDTRFEQLGIIIPVGKSRLGIDARGFYSDNMLYAEEENIDSTMFRYYAADIALNYAYDFQGKMQAGANLDILMSGAGDYAQTGAVFDMGLLYRPLDNLYTSLALKGIGVNLKYIDENYQPVRITLGASYSVDELMLSLDGSYFPNENHLVEAGTGIEYSINNLLFLRAGYLFSTGNMNFLDNVRGGMGINMGPSQIHYSASYHSELGLIHNIGLVFDFSSISRRRKEKEEELYLEMEKRLEDKEKMMSDMFMNKAKQNLENNEYDAALENIDLALIWYPDNHEAETLSGIIEKNREKWELENEIDRGVAHYMAGDYLNAMNVFNEVITDDPDNEKANDYYKRARDAYNRQMAESEMKDELNEAVKLYENGKYAEALELFATLKNEGVSGAEEYLRKTKDRINLIIEKEFKAAERQYKNGNYASALSKSRSLIKYNVKTEEIEQLIESIKTAMQQDVNVYLEKGISLYNDNKYKEAEEYFRKVIAIDSMNSRAENYIEKIKSKDIYSSEDIESLYLKGIEAYTNNNFRLSIEYWKKCLEIRPDYSKAEKNIEKARKKLEELSQ